jgi:hypothetical protein
MSCGAALALGALVECPDPGGVPVLVELDDVEGPVAVLPAVEQRVAVHSAQVGLFGEGDVRGKFESASEMTTKLLLAEQAAVGRPQRVTTVGAAKSTVSE